MNSAWPSDGASALAGAGTPGLTSQTQAGWQVDVAAAPETAVAGIPEVLAPTHMDDVALLPAASPVSDFMIYRLERALRERVRYRYVEPLVLREGQSFRIQSPCCSRNVDPSGGLIDIALLTPGATDATGAGGAGVGWSLSARDHLKSVWRVCLSDAPLELLLDALCVDSERQFWP